MKAKIITQLIIGFLFLAVSPGHAQNILTDGDFSKITEILSFNTGMPPTDIWHSRNSAETKAAATVVNGVCNFDITTAGNHYYDVQLSQSGFSLIKEHLYRLSIKVKSDTERSFGVFLGQDGDPWTNLITSEKYVQNSFRDWKTISIEVKVKKVFENYRLTFDIGNQNVKIYFDDINLVDLGPIPIPVKRKPQPANLVLGEWFPASTSGGGLGSNFKFMPDGKVESSFGAFIHFKYKIEGDSLVSIFPSEKPMKVQFKIDGEKLKLIGGRGVQELTRISGDANSGIVGRWIGDHYTGKKQILDFTALQNQYLSVPFDSNEENYQVKDDSIKITGKQAMSFMWYVEADTLNLVVGDDSQTSKFVRIK